MAGTYVSIGACAKSASTPGYSGQPAGSKSAGRPTLPYVNWSGSLRSTPDAGLTQQPSVRGRAAHTETAWDIGAERRTADADRCSGNTDRQTDGQ